MSTVMQVSLDDGSSWAPVASNVRVRFLNAANPAIYDEDTMLAVRLSADGLLLDHRGNLSGEVFGSAEAPLAMLVEWTDD